jgi:catechol 2,3-dioxygenase-like lactoylglutathione lyase family enzyme
VPKHDVGGLLLDRPFKIQRLGHIGLNVSDPDVVAPFYTELMGLRISDVLDFRPRASQPEQFAGMGAPTACFMRCGTDHHSLVLFNARVFAQVAPQRRFGPGIVLNQAAWQVGTLEEVVRGAEWLHEQGIEIIQVGRDQPGSNWHVYFYDPDGHINELFYGMDQIGWDSRSKPPELQQLRGSQAPQLPIEPERDEIERAAAVGARLESGQRHVDALPARFDVGGVLLPRPFRVTHVGPLRLFVRDVAASEDFYRENMGLSLTERAEWRGRSCAFLRAGTDHHALALYQQAIQDELGLAGRGTCLSIGLRVGSYRQLRDALGFLRDRGASIIELPPELSPGIDYSFHVADADGNLLQLYFAIDHIGWQGSPRPSSSPALSLDDWPEAIGDSPAAGEVFLGPLG